MAVSVRLRGGENWQKALRPYAGAGKASLAVGILEGAMYEDGTPVASVAAVHEFGAAHVPARSFMRSTLEQKGERWGQILRHEMKRLKGDARRALTSLGEVASKDMQKAIEDGLSPALKAATILAKERRGKDNKVIDRKRNQGKSRPELPLVDTGTMQEAISYEVRP